MNQQDLLFREMVSHPDCQQDLIRICLPDVAQTIDMDSVRKVDTAFIGVPEEDLLLSASRHDGIDVLIYIIAKHDRKNANALPSFFRKAVDRIRHELWADKPEDERGPQPHVFTVVFYYGNEPWIAPRSSVDSSEAERLTEGVENDRRSRRRRR